MDTTLILNRVIYTDNSTIGDLLIDGVFQCNTLEDTCRRRAGPDGILQPHEKVYGETAIPSGKYEIKMEWSNHFKRKMPFLQDVPYFSGVMIHWGNRPKDTLGCILVGTKSMKDDWIENSLKNYNLLEPKLTKALELGKLFISIGGGYTV